MIFFLSSALFDRSGDFLYARHEFVEERAAEARLQFAGQIVRLGQILRGQLAQPLLCRRRS